MLQRKSWAHICIFVALAVCAAMSATAGINSLTPLRPEGGSVFKVEFHPTRDSTAFIGSPSGFYHSTDGGMSWTLSIGVPRDHIHDFAVDPNNGNRVFIAAVNHGIFVSTDAGVTASRLTTLPNVLSGPSSIEISGDGTLYVVAQDRLFRSTDAGATWQERTAPTVPMYVNSLRVDPSDSDALFVFVGRDGFRSTNGGVSWDRIAFPEVTRDLIIISEEAPQLVFAATHAGVRVSSDGGANWASAGLPASTLVLAVNPTDSDVLYAGAYPEGLFRTSNQGGVWNNIHGNARTGEMSSIAVSPVNPDLVLIAGYEGLARSSSGGATWTSVNAGLISTSVEKFVAVPESQRIYLHTYSNGIFMLERGATRAIPVNPEGIAAASSGNTLLSFDLFAQGGASDRLFLGMNGGFAWSTDGGHRWQWTHTMGSGAVSRLSSFRLQPDVMLASAYPSVHRSIDGGITWTRVAGLPEFSEASVFAHAPSSESVIYAGILGAPAPPTNTSAPLGIYKSTNGGADWTPANGALTPDYVGQIEVDPRTEQTVYAVMSTGLFKTLNGGESWNAVNIGSTSPSMHAVSSVSIDTRRPDTIYVVQLGRVARSIDGGSGIWEDIHVASNSSEQASRVFADPFRDHTVLVGTFFQGAAEMTIATDVELETSVPSVVPHGLPNAYTYTVRNLGPFHATDLRTVIQLPSTARDTSVSATSGSCSVQGVTVTCTQAAMLAGRATQITVTSTNPERGAMEVLASAQSSEPDTQTSNNSVRSAFEVERISDLSVTASSPATVSEGNGITYSIVVANAGPQEAVDVIARIELAAGLSLATSSASRGSCNASAGLVTCAVGNLASGANATITLATVSASAGTYETTVRVDAAVSDAVAQNDAAAVRTIVNRNSNGGAAGGGGSGGGSTSPWLLALLAYFALQRATMTVRVRGCARRRI